MRIKNHLWLIFCVTLSASAYSQASFHKVEQWATHEIELNSSKNYENAYMDVDVWAEFINEKGEKLIRPAFWDGGNIWKVRFAPTDNDNTWRWKSYSSELKDSGLHGKTGVFQSVPNTSGNIFSKNGFLKVSPAKRNVVYHSGKPFLMIGDTPWAMPFRATTDQVVHYAENRKKRGFNAALMMSLQPDTKAEGPNKRNIGQGFHRAFSDLSEGHITQMQPDYFQYLDRIIDILIDHEIVPVYQPVFHGFGWKGLDALGPYIDTDEYVRYCKYLLARYGSRPAMWLLGADHAGNDPGVKESGEMIEKWDCYKQPTGLHYNPCDNYIAGFAVKNPDKQCMHFNKAHQSEDWLDFQWAQTGHNGVHIYYKVDRMFDNKPTKAVANGESTYEGMSNGKYGMGWWQGEDAWSQLVSGSTMGVVYGAPSLWQWKITADEEGWSGWAFHPYFWKTVLELEGSAHVGRLGKILKGYDLTDIDREYDLSVSKSYLVKEGELYIAFLNSGGAITLKDVPNDMKYTWINPKTGKGKAKSTVTGEAFVAPDDSPWVLLVTK